MRMKAETDLCDLVGVSDAAAVYFYFVQANYSFKVQ